MLEKEPDSMAVTMKQDYAASEVYSTTSEAPPVSVQQIDLIVKLNRFSSLVFVPTGG